jgi:hypothetical protein
MVGVQWRNTISIRSASLCVMAALWGGYTKPVSFPILEDYDKGSSLQRIAADFALFRMFEPGNQVYPHSCLAKMLGPTLCCIRVVPSWASRQ